MTDGAFIPEIDLSQARTCYKFMMDNTSVRVIVGPVGSGKSVTCCFEIIRRAWMQEPSPIDNIRRFRAMIVRNTMPELKTTTMETWLQVVPEKRVGEMRRTVPIRHHIMAAPRGDQPGLDLQVDFVGLDRPKDVRRLLSYEGTLIWMNECREIRKDIFEAAQDRVGRYPSIQNGGIMPSWFGVIGDTNPPDDDHWLSKLIDENPEGHSFYQQPPGVVEAEEYDAGWRSIDAACPTLYTENPDRVMEAAQTYWMANPDAENLKNLPIDPESSGDILGKGGYYLKRCSGKTRSRIRIYYQGRRGFAVDGRPVTPEFDPASMVREFSILETEPVQGGFDIGGGTIHPYACFAQKHPQGPWMVGAEVYEGDVGLDEFADLVLKKIQEFYPKSKIGNFWGDPAARKRDELFATTAFDHLQGKGVPVFPVDSNDPLLRIEACRAPMRRNFNGVPGIIIHPRCSMLIKAFSGGWNYKRVLLTGEERFKDTPDKNEYSHPGDGCGYFLLGAGEGKALKGRRSRKSRGVHRANTAFNPHTGKAI